MLQAVTPSGRESSPEQKPFFTYDAHPERYAHWKLSFEGAVATLTMNVDEDRGLVPGYKLKLNSYDLGVDIELADALQRIRFEHPEVRSVIITSGKERVFCSGANIFMLGLSAHSWKVNFCKFTNETRNGIEDSSAHSGLKRLVDLIEQRCDLVGASRNIAGDRRLTKDRTVDWFAFGGQTPLANIARHEPSIVGGFHHRLMLGVVVPLIHQIGSLPFPAEI